MTSAPSRTWAFAGLLAALSMLGPFSIDTYLPAFHDVAAGLNTSLIHVQQTLTAYLVAFAVMMLWHGALSDALGRRIVVLAGLGMFAFSSLGCVFAGNWETMMLFRVLQGASAGAGLVVGRAIIRDSFQGPEAQRLMSQVTLTFGIAPAIAPVLGGLLLTAFGWRSIFVFLLIFTVVLFAATWRWLPETHPPKLRQPLEPKVLLRNYKSVLLTRNFVLLGSATAFNFSGFFVYIPSAPVFLMQHLGASAQGFAWLFIPAISGIMTGALISGRIAGKHSPAKTVFTAYAIMTAAALANVLLCLLAPPALPWNVIPLFFYTLGMSLAMPSITLLVLDLFPHLRGMVSSAQGFAQTMLSGVVAGLVSPLVSGSLLGLSLTMLGFMVVGGSCWFVYQASAGKHIHHIPGDH